MSTRRQPSTTSLSKYARAHSPIPQNRSLDFCNAFWGLNDAGVDVLFARMRGAVRTMDELKTYWKERAIIEEDYAKRLAKLAKMTLGRDEIGELRNSLDTLRLETDKQAGYHMTLAQQIRNDLESQATIFYNKQTHHKKAYQSVIEKEFKAKQVQESYVVKARDKYEADCVRINSYSAQSSIIQGRELEKVTQKLERAQQTVQANERDFANFSKALQDTVQKWEQNWKSFCDGCQDLEEQRIEFMKDNMWAYANAVSTVCVADDESCEKMRLALELLEPDRDMENFVRDYGTGNQIPDPPQFDDEPFVNTAGIGAGGGLKRAETQTQDQTPINRQGTQKNGFSPVPAQVNGTSASPMASSPEPLPDQLSKRRSMAYQNAEHSSARASSKPDPQAEPIDPTAETFIKVGNSAYKVDLSKDPQHAGPSSSRASASLPMRPESNIDPLARQLEELKIAVQNSGSGRRNTVVKSPQDARPAQPSHRKSLEPIAGSSALSPPGSNPPNQGSTPNRDYRNSAEFVVGAHPSVSRSPSPSPNAPTAAFMVPKSASPHSGTDVQRVVSEYGQSLPGERSRPNSRRSSHIPQGSTGSVNLVQQGQNLASPPSQLGHVAHGGSRSASPQPPVSRGPSPGPSRNSYIAPPPPPPNINRAPSPNSVGIALDPSGRVLHDDMARWYEQQKQQQQHPQYQQRPMPQQQQQQQQHSTPISTAPPSQSMIWRQNTANSHSPVPPSPIQPNYANMTQAAPAYQPPAPAAAPPTPQGYLPSQPAYNSPMTYQPPPPVHQTLPQQQPMYPYHAANGVQRGGSLGGTAPYYTNGMSQPQGVYGGGQMHHQSQQQFGTPQNSYMDNRLVGRSPSPQPPPIQTMPPSQPMSQMGRGTGQTTEEGAPILFYVKALYDYGATIEEEFDFQAGDIIAVTATPEDGWWSGELLDEARRQKGRHVFPSNFVCLF
ncbi:SH3 domain-containing protein [Amanita rubescens]|nr:SH3 domain-containing protein [Amanita rubescens]